jgi:acetyl esterase/lipase
VATAAGATAAGAAAAAAGDPVPAANAGVVDTDGDPRSRGAAAVDAARAAAREEFESEITIPCEGRDPVPARIYGRRVSGGGPLVLHFHGGTFACGSLDNGRTMSRLLVRSGAVVVSLAYPLAPAHPFPAGVETGYAALEWLYRQRTRLAGKAARIYLAGEEAGANLAAALALVSRDRGHPPLAGQILVSPMLDPCAGTQSLRDASNETHECRWAAGWHAYLRSPNDTLHPYAVPGASLRLADLPPTLILVGSDDAMRDEGLRFGSRLAAAGIAVTQAVVATRRCWPEALYAPAAGGDCVCENVMTGRLKAFFDSGAPPPH